MLHTIPCEPLSPLAAKAFSIVLPFTRHRRQDDGRMKRKPSLTSHLPQGAQGRAGFPIHHILRLYPLSKMLVYWREILNILVSNLCRV